MKRLMGLVVLVLLADSGVAAAHGGTERGALGFHSVDAPLGIRWWLTDRVAFDGGVGFGSRDLGSENVTNFTLDLGIPMMLKTWDKAHFLFRPGVGYHSQQVITDPGPPVVKDSDITFTISAELEAEVFLADHVSLSAAHGIAIIKDDPAGGASFTDWGTTGSNFTTIGFHVYLFGGR